MLHTGLVDSGAKQPSDRIQTTASVFWFVGETWKLFDAHISVFNPNLWLSVSSLWYTLVGQWQLLLVNSGIQKVKQSICVWAESQAHFGSLVLIDQSVPERISFPVEEFFQLVQLWVISGTSCARGTSLDLFYGSGTHSDQIYINWCQLICGYGKGYPNKFTGDCRTLTPGFASAITISLYFTHDTILWQFHLFFFLVQMMSSKLNFDSICLIQHDKVVVLSSAVTETWRQCCHKKESSCCRSDIKLKVSNYMEPVSDSTSTDCHQRLSDF